MRSSVLRSALLLLSCAAAGAALGLSLRGGTWAILSPMFLVPQFYAITGKSSWIEPDACSALFGLSFYAVAFQGLLGPMDGAFAGIWMLLTVVYAAFHVTVCLVFRLCKFRIESGGIWLLPPALVAYEYLRHLLTKLYDDCGLTFCLVGQSWADNDWLLQSADVGGVWLLSFMVASGGATITTCVIQIRSRASTAMLGTFVASLVLMLLYGSLRLSTATGPVVGHVVIVPNRLTVEMLQNQAFPLVDEIREQARSGTARPWCCLASPETSMFWNINDSSSDEHPHNIQDELLGFTNRFQCDAIVGAWVPSPTSSLNRNAVVVVRSGQVTTIVDKQHPVPFVEGYPLGTESLRSIGLIPNLVETRRLAPIIPPKTEDWREHSIPWAVGVCYDLFFPATFRQYDISQSDAIVCSLDETFDDNGVFRELSAIHSRLRAVEFRRSVIRSSVGGSSGVYDSKGSVIDPINRRGIATLYEIRSTKQWSLYARLGDWFPLLCSLVTIGMLAPKRKSSNVGCVERAGRPR